MIRISLTCYPASRLSSYTHTTGETHMAAVLCIDCKSVATDDGIYVCTDQRLKSPVDGTMSTANAAIAVRANMAQCAPEGRWYTPIDTMVPPMPQADEPEVAKE